MKPNEEEIPSGICECGCGRPTHISTHTNRKRRHFKGYPSPYLHGHGPRKHGPEHHLFKGVRRANGYIYEYTPDHPRALDNKSDMSGYVLQHRLVWEKANGRLLRSDEVIHHINGVRDDNRLENLVALTNSNHCALHADDHANGHSPESRKRISAAMKRVWAERHSAKLS